MRGAHLRRTTAAALLFLFSFLAGTGCDKAPASRDVEVVESLDRALRGAGAPLSFPEGYARFHADLLFARSILAEEEERFPLFRDLDRVDALYSGLAASGSRLLMEVHEARERLREDLSVRHDAALGRLLSLRELSTQMNEGRLSRRPLMRAEIDLKEAAKNLSSSRLDEARSALQRAENDLARAAASLNSTLGRYADPAQVALWQKWVEETIVQSKRSKGLAIIVIKLDRQLILYRGGRPVKRYTVGLGRNGLSDKVMGGDHATPEGRYKVTVKNPNSAFHKALLINYPNDEDRRNFEKLRKQGRVSSGARIGNLVEIHGGGREIVTLGCVSLDNPQMDELYGLVSVGTPVTIVGALKTLETEALGEGKR